jgi:hypothetical protein
MITTSQVFGDKVTRTESFLFYSLMQPFIKGILGENVNVCFVDDGLDYNSDDLKDNYVISFGSSINLYRACSKY